MSKRGANVVLVTADERAEVLHRRGVSRVVRTGVPMSAELTRTQNGDQTPPPRRWVGAVSGGGGGEGCCTRCRVDRFEGTQPRVPGSRQQWHSARGSAHPSSARHSRATDGVEHSCAETLQPRGSLTVPPSQQYAVHRRASRERGARWSAGWGRAVDSGAAPEHPIATHGDASRAPSKPADTVANTTDCFIADCFISSPCHERAEVGVAAGRRGSISAA